MAWLCGLFWFFIYNFVCQAFIVHTERYCSLSLFFSGVYISKGGPKDEQGHCKVVRRAGCNRGRDYILQSGKPSIFGLFEPGVDV